MTAFAIWMDGDAAYRPNPITAGLPHIVGTRKRCFSMRKGDIPKYITRYFWQWFDVWWWYHDKGLLPLATSWFHHPKHVTDVIQMLEGFYQSYMAEKVRRGADG